MIDPFNLPRPLQGTVLQLGPDTPHLVNLGPAGFRGIEHPRLGGEALGFQLASRGQNVGMMVALIAFAVRRMDCHIDGHAVPTDELLGELAGDL